MPTYEYECVACNYMFEVFQKITANPLKRCPKCKRMKARRLIGRGAGIIFKGSGFYQTDYRSESYNKGMKAEKGSSTGQSGKDGAKPDKAGSSGASAGEKSVKKKE